MRQHDVLPWWSDAPSVASSHEGQYFRRRKFCVTHTGLQTTVDQIAQFAINLQTAMLRMKAEITGHGSIPAVGDVTKQLNQR